MNIILIGYRCTGKTSVGQTIAKHLDWPFVDGDIELVKKAGKTIADIVSEQGWDEFRKIEKAVVKRLSLLDSHVIAPGGGAVLDTENIKNMKQNGTLVWLRALPETIKERMLQDQTTEDSRPSLTSQSLDDEIRETLVQRTPVYKGAADIIINTDKISINDVCKMIIQKLGNV